MNLILKEFREKNGWTQEELAEKVGVSKGTINRWEQRKSNPSKLATEKLIELGINIGNLESNEEDFRLGNEREFNYNGQKYFVKPQPYVLNAPSDQNYFHDLLITIQEQMNTSIPWDVYKKRLSMIEYVEPGTKTSQSILEKENLMQRVGIQTMGHMVGIDT